MTNNNRPTLSLKKQIEAAVSTEGVNEPPEIKFDYGAEAQNLGANHPPKGQGSNSYKALQKTLYKLSEKFPDTFSWPEPARALKIGILEDIVAVRPKKSKTHYRRALALYTNSKKYKQVIVDTKERHDLEGNVCGMVTNEHKEVAAVKIPSRPETRKTKQRNSDDIICKHVG